MYCSTTKSAAAAPSDNPNDDMSATYLTLESGATRTESDTLSMDHLYQEWTLEQDRMLWDNREQPISTLASLLGRGLRGTEKRLAKLRNVDSTAYQRLFADGTNSRPSNNGDDDTGSSPAASKLVPASQVLRRIQWDASLSANDFVIMHFDRVRNSIVESSMEASNDSIAGSATRFVDALPEHRIVGIKYKERVVWNREQRIDRFFGQEGIVAVIQGYTEWKANRDAEQERERQRQAHVSDTLQQILGLEHFRELQSLLMDWRDLLAEDATRSKKLETERVVTSALDLFRKVRSGNHDQGRLVGQSTIPTSDEQALDTLSEFVAARVDDPNLRELVLGEIALRIQQCQGYKIPTPRRYQLPELKEDEVTETFVRGSGPGGQKINKTSNRVVLVHEPTQIRVECQETRSLPLNRKLARQRLREKLDEYYNGQQSKANLVAQKAASKKAKVKARNRARQRDRNTKDTDQT
jgi:uncharacterized protein (UPF0248 family)